MKLKYFGSIPWRIHSVPLLFFFLAGCSSGNFQLIEQMSDKALNDIACGNVQNLMMDDLKHYLISEKSLPDIVQIKKQLHEKSSKKLAGLSSEKRKKIESLLDEWAEMLIETLPAKMQSQNPVDVLVQISALDVGDQSDDLRKVLNQEKIKKIKRLSDQLEAANLECPANSPAEDNNPSLGTEDLAARARSKGIELPAFGARWVMATAYQSCQALDKNPLQKEDPAVRGISIVGQHADGVGSRRVIQSLNLVQKTHPYLDSAIHKTCFDVYAQPLIYDYGGKPFTEGTVNAALNLHRNAGDGTKVLGIDCSGFVFSSFAAAGLRLQKNRNLKSTDVYAWGSGSYVEPENNGLSCLQKISMTDDESIQSGDVVAIQGHVLLIEDVGTDPFGVQRIPEKSKCGTLKSSDFDFSIIQSSNSKSGIGINRYKARDYFLPGDSMTHGVEAYAVAACNAYFDKKTTTVKNNEVVIVRHLKTDECKDQRVELTDESCIQSCPQL